MRNYSLRRIGALAVIAFAGAGSGCATTSNTERGALAGGVIGTAGGAAIGAATGKPLLGAALGGLGGTATGALIGNGVDKDENRKREIAQAAALADAQYQQQRMGIADVIALSQAKHNDQVIINQIRSTHSTFQLTVSDLDMLKNAGVTDAVIAEMQASRPTAAPGRVVVREQPSTVIYESGPPAVVVRPRPVVVVGPPPPRYYYRGGYGYGYYCR